MPWSDSARARAHRVRVRSCKKCKAEYETRSANSKWCPACREIKKTEYREKTKAKMNIRYPKGFWLCYTCWERKPIGLFKNKYKKCNDCREKKP